MAFSNNPRFADNSQLYPDYNDPNIVKLAVSHGDRTYTSTPGATSFQLFGASKGSDRITGFSANDTLAVDHMLFDGNGDGYIDFGANGLLDVNRTGGGSNKAGKYQVNVVGTGDDNIGSVRYLGTKSGQAVYAAASTRDQLLGHFKTGMDSTNGLSLKYGDSSLAGIDIRYEGSVNNDTIDAGKGATAILYDNALGINHGGDTINNFGSDDLLIFTNELYKSKTETMIGFGGNKVLDLAAQAPEPNDSDYLGNGGAGGQIDVNGVGRDVQTLAFLGTKTIGTGVGAATYYYYGTVDHAPVDGLTI